MSWRQAAVALVFVMTQESLVILIVVTTVSATIHPPPSIAIADVVHHVATIRLLLRAWTLLGWTAVI